MASLRGQVVARIFPRHVLPTAFKSFTTEFFSLGYTVFWGKSCSNRPIAGTEQIPDMTTEARTVYPLTKNRRQFCLGRRLDDNEFPFRPAIGAPDRGVILREQECANSV